MAEKTTAVKTPTPLRDIVRSANLLSEKRKEAETARRDAKREWALNREFYKGNQWAWWNQTQLQVESLPPIVETDEGRHRVRIVSNEILPGVQNVIAQLTKTRPIIQATPDSGDERDAKAAQLAQGLVEYWWDQFHMKSKLQRALLHSQLSEGYWKITWDPLAGATMKMMMNPQTGQVITDQEMADAYVEQIEAIAQAQQMDPQEILSQVQKTIMMGEIRVDVFPAEQVLVDPAAQEFGDAKWVICTHAMDPEEVKARWGKEVQPNMNARETSFPDRAFGDKETVTKATRDVYIGYFKPSPILPKGRYVAWIEGPNTILAQSDWPYPFKELPLVKFPGRLNPDGARDEPRVSSARGLNKELNRTLSQIIMHKNLTLKPQMVAPIGSLRQRITDEPGAVFEYQPIAGLSPEWRPIPNLPPYVFEHAQDIQRRIDKIFNQVPSERTQLPPRVDAGYTVELLQEAVADQLSPEVQRIEQALCEAGMLMLQLAQEYYTEPRLLKIRGSNGSTQVKKFMNSDLSGGFSLRAESGSGLPQTKAGRRQQIKDLVDMKAISPQDALPYLGISDLSGIADQLAGDEDHAYREIGKLIGGQPLNPMAMQQAVQAIQAGQPNPQTGQPFQSMEEAQAFVEQAGLQPLPYENMGIHMKILQEHLVSPAFEKYDPQTQGRFITHYQMTQQAIQQATAGATQPGPPVRTSLSLKGTVGPTMAAAIMRKSGVPEATPEAFTEAPLETSVYDSVDKPDQDDAGNDPMSELDQQQLQIANQVEAMKGAHEVALAQQKTQSAHASQLANEQRAQEKHAQDMHHAARQQGIAEAQAVAQAQDQAAQAEAQRNATEQAAQQGGGDSGE